ncbi:MAG: hypothetical protein QMD53_03440 [Actinomycetota bacterium]|nr:hypothetical protein [Actinomycetota bacterium]
MTSYLTDQNNIAAIRLFLGIILGLVSGLFAFISGGDIINIFYKRALLAFILVSILVRAVSYVIRKIFSEAAIADCVTRRQRANPAST